MIFAEVIEGLKNGQNFTRINSPLLNGKFITMQIPADIPTDVIPKWRALMTTQRLFSEQLEIAKFIIVIKFLW